MDFCNILKPMTWIGQTIYSKDNKIKVVCNMEHDEMYNTLYVLSDNAYAGYIMCGYIKMDAVFSIKNGDIPNDILRLIDAVNKTFKKPIDSFNGPYVFYKVDEYLTESMDMEIWNNIFRK